MHSRWSVITVMFAGNVLNYADRVALPLLVPVISSELNIGTIKTGIVLSSFFLGYAVLNLVGGYAADRFGARKVIAISVVCWSVSCMLTAAVNTLEALLLTRLLFGASEGPFGASSAKLIKNWFPQRELGTAMGLLSSGTVVGGALASPLVGAVALWYGWRSVFVLFGIAGLLWAAFWINSSAETPTPTLGSAMVEDKNESLGQRHADYHREFLRLISRRLILSTAVAYFSYSYVLFFFLSWFPSYVMQTYGAGLLTAGSLNAIPWTLGLGGLIAGGYCSDILSRLTGDPGSSRKVVVVVGLFFAASAILALSKISSLQVAVVVMSIATFMMYATGAIYWVIIQETVSSDYVGSVGGFVHFCANIAGVFSPLITGVLVERSGSFSAAFLVAGTVAMTGGMSLLLFGNPNSLQKRQH